MILILFMYILNRGIMFNVIVLILNTTPKNVFIFNQYNNKVQFGVGIIY